MFLSKLLSLTEIQLYSVSRYFINQGLAERLGMELDIKQYDVDAIIYNKKGDIQGAAHEILKRWNLNQPDKKKAYKILWKALCRIGRYPAARDVLKFPPCIYKS